MGGRGVTQAVDTAKLLHNHSAGKKAQFLEIKKVI
jgi:hypothetical protein